MSTTEDKISNAGTWGGAIVAAISGLSLSDVGVIFGMLLGTLSLAYNIWHKRALRKILRDKREVHIDVDGEA